MSFFYQPYCNLDDVLAVAWKSAYILQRGLILWKVEEEEEEETPNTPVKKVLLSIKMDGRLCC